MEGYNWCSDLPLFTKVRVYGALIASNKKLVNIEDDVMFIDDESDEVC